MKQLWRLLVLVALVAEFGGNAVAQAYPSKPIRFVVSVAAGGGPDIPARLIGPKMTDALNQPVLVENRPGAAGNLAVDAVAKAAPDGYTILVTTDSLAISPAVYRKLPFDALKDLVPVTQLVASPAILMSAPKLPASSMRELVALAKSKSGGLSYGHPGVGSSLQLQIELLKLRAGIDVLPIPYKGISQIVVALMVGELDVAAVPVMTGLQSIKSGSGVRAIAVLDDRRLAALPDVPTAAEAGFAGVESVSWHGMFVPAKTPHEIVELIQREAVRALHMPDVGDRLRAIGLEPVGSTPEEFDAKYRADLAKFVRIVKDAGIAQQD